MESEEYVLASFKIMSHNLKPNSNILFEFVNKDRPFAKKTRTVRFSSKFLKEYLSGLDFNVIKIKGCFFIPMTFFEYAPTFLLRLLNLLDRVLSSVFPKMCSRI